MSDDKIKISWDELSSTNSRTTNEAKYTPPQQTTSQLYSDPRADTTKDNTPLLIAAIIGAVVVLGILFFVCKAGIEGKETPFHRQTVDEWCANATEKLNRELAKHYREHPEDFEDE